MELHGYYLDPTCRKYFRVIPGFNNHNPINRRKILRRRLNNSLKLNGKFSSQSIVQNFHKYQLGIINRNEYIEQLIRIKLQSLNSPIVLGEYKIQPYTKCYLKGFPEKSRLVFSISSSKGSTLSVFKVRQKKSNKLEEEGNVLRFKEKAYNFSEVLVDCDDFGQFGLICYYTANASMNMCGNEVIKIVTPDESTLTIGTKFIGYKHVNRCIAANPNTCTLANAKATDVKLFNIDSNYMNSWTSRKLKSGNPWSLRYNLRRNCLYVGCNTGYFHGIDERIDKCAFKSKNPVFDNVLTDIAALKDGSSVILSSVGQYIKLYDVRMQGVVLDYQTFPLENPHIFRIPVCVDEISNIMSSVGQDGNVRFWNLNTGTLSYVLEISEEDVLPIDGDPPLAWTTSLWNKRLKQTMILYNKDFKLCNYYL